MTSVEPGVLMRWLRTLLWTCAVLCLGWVGIISLQARLFDRDAREAFTVAVGHADPLVANAGKIPIVGILEIPRLGFSEVVAEGDHDSTLRVAIGHLPDTPLPWQAGNSALAGHRDGRFRQLKDVRAGDHIRLQTHQGTLDYVVRETHIVDPDDVWVLNPTASRTLTLITCYPFDFVGSAPRRYVLMAEAAAPGDSGYKSSGGTTK